MPDMITWGHHRFQLRFSWSPNEPVRLAAVTREGSQTGLHAMPIVDVLTVAAGSSPASDRLVHTTTGRRLRYDSHTSGTTEKAAWLHIVQTDGVLRVTTLLEQPDGIAAVRARTLVTNISAAPAILRSVTSWASGFSAELAEAGNPPSPDSHELASPEHDSPEHDSPAPDALAGWSRLSGTSDWLAEGRWASTPLRGPELPDLAEHLTGHDARSAIEVTSDGTWSTGKHLPTSFLENPEQSLAWGWHIEHNGAWRWEIGEDTTGGYVAVSGPTESDSGWTRVLAPTEKFESVPAVVSFGNGFDDVVEALTAFRRWARRPHSDNSSMRVVFNDYMNTLDGDPTTEKLLPLIDAAAAVGAEIFCIDAGWYDDSGHWWDSVGAWRPSTTRFPGGFGEVIDAIRAAGMAPGLWLEPEVVGVRSPVAESLPREAFLLRHGERVEEHDRYHLDLRHPAAVEHLDTVVDALVSEFGIEFFKFDYNINPGAGTDHDADSLGDGLLKHNRAHLAWLDYLLDRHPDLVIENCSSGAMRADPAMLARVAMQSTSDQQDFTKFPPIAAAAPLSMLPEQAASWAYPQPSMTPEEAAFSLVTGLLGRFYLSGYINMMTDDGRSLIAEAVNAAKALRADISTSVPFWPLGLPGWTDNWISLGLHGPDTDLLSLWRRSANEPAVSIRLPHLIGHRLSITTVFPTQLTPWDIAWDPATGTLSVRTDYVSGDSPVAARTLRLRSLEPTDQRPAQRAITRSRTITEN